MLIYPKLCDSQLLYSHFLSYTNILLSTHNLFVSRYIYKCKQTQLFYFNQGNHNDPGSLLRPFFRSVLGQYFAQRSLFVQTYQLSNNKFYSWVIIRSVFWHKVFAVWTKHKTFVFAKREKYLFRYILLGHYFLFDYVYYNDLAEVIIYFLGCVYPDSITTRGDPTQHLFLLKSCTIHVSYMQKTTG